MPGRCAATSTRSRRKAYWRHFQPAPEFVVLFVPGEPLLDAALAVDPGLSDHAFGRNVVIATPTSLIALLRTVAFTWRQEQLSASAAEVHALGRELHGRLGTLAGHLSGLGTGLERAVQSYNHTVRSMETRVLVTARRFADLGVTGEELPSPEPVETAAAAAPGDRGSTRPSRRDAAQVTPLRSAAQTGLGRYR